MTTMTIHADEAFAEALRAYAQGAKMSVNKAVQALIAPLLGLTENKDDDSNNPFLRHCGILNKSEKESLAKSVSSQRTIDPEMWK